MANRIEDMKKKATELTETRRGLAEHKKINAADLTIVDELFELSLKDDEALLDVNTLAKSINTEQKILESDIKENKEAIFKIGDEVDGFVDELQKNLHEFEQMEKTTDLLNLDEQKRETEEKIGTLEDVKNILGLEISNDRNGESNSIETLDINESKREILDDFKNKYDMVYYNHPTVQIPQTLTHSAQPWRTADDGSIYFNNPIETGKTLNSNQGKAVNNFIGTCGLVSCANLLTMAGVKISEADMVFYASTHRNNKSGELLCTIDDRPSFNGGTTYTDRQQILSYFGLQSHIQKATVDNISNAITDGKGVILAVDAGYFWNERRYRGMGHAVTVTSVRKQGDRIISFYICDSGTDGNDSAREVPVKTISKAIRGNYFNVTEKTIR